MKEKILEKLDMEYEIFFLEMIKTTKENLFAKSGEIETKKSIVIFLNDEIRNNKNIQGEKMLTSNGIIDEFYRYVTDHKEISFDEARKIYMKNYTEQI